MSHGELATQLTGLLVDAGVLHGAPDQLSGTGRRPLGVLGRKMPQITPRIADLNMKDMRVGDTRIDNRSTHGA